ncbi:50S ribosomal protein L10 [Methanobrevibacter cuticularis]|uniref:Large ribosomal subunit protein uL10 n=1 Tax=Methanobrevibacter cuticularis TaxID=47311 RepID=A0A166DPA5_9EURY|nr:50S ribosomal protein L10 [Methanobrevibacter cuticularis]KZX15814.1 50S ribosomal protein L10 [Methanobrevibacter cuticularis]
MAHVAEWKKEEVKTIKSLIDSHEVVGIVDLLNIPAKQLQKMRQTLKDKATIRMSKKNLIDLAFEDSNVKKENIVGLSKFMEGQPAMVFTDMNPFRLFKILEDSKTAAPAKAGNIATDDIVVPAGDTGFEPGPLLGELQQVGIPAKIDKGKIVVSKDHVVVKAGEEVSKQVAGMLTRLDIHPMEVGIDLKAAYEDEAVYTSDVLTIDDEETLISIQNAFSSAFNLSVNAGVPTKETIVAIIQNANSKSFNLAMNASILTSETTEPLLALAQSEMLALASAVSDSEGALDEELIEKLSNVPVPAETVVVVEEKEDDDEEEEEEEASEEEAAAGLGALFG